MLAYADVCWRMLTYAGVSAETDAVLDTLPVSSVQAMWRGSDATAATATALAGKAKAIVSSRILTYHHVSSRILAHADVSWRILTYPHVSLRMLTYVDVC
jgi:hypothetical protein